MNIEINGMNITIMQGLNGICCSGGVDSSLLLYILMKYSTQRLTIFTLVRNTNSRIAAFVTTKVIEQCIKLTNNNNIDHYVYYNDYQDRTQIFSTPTSFLIDGRIESCYTGITANPPKEIADNFITVNYNSQYANRDPLIIKDIILPSENRFHPKEQYIRPFINIDKKRIALMYKELGLMESLFPLTYSCEEYKEQITFEHCGECWWCKEREWGFSSVTSTV